ncbi:MAG: hypothetical protein JNM14_12115 [Ferruginibacter sp.]|nr:hypothetical protein [Ferruginibacter sp.]
MKKILLCCSFTILVLIISCGERIKEENPVEMNEKGIQLINDGKQEEALQLFLKAIKSPKLSGDYKGTIYRNIGVTYNQLDKKDSAIHYSTLAYKCFRKNSYDYLINAADVDLYRGKTAAALPKLLKAVKMEPDDMAVNNTLGLLYLGEYGDTFIDLDKALAYNLKAFDITSSRTMEEVLALNYYKLENYEKAELHYEHLHQNYPDMISYTLDMGLAKYKLKKKTEANKLFEEVLAKDSSYRETIDIFKDNNR